MRPDNWSPVPMGQAPAGMPPTQPSSDASSRGGGERPWLQPNFCPAPPPPRPLVLSHWVVATAFPCESWALSCPRPHGWCGGCRLGPQLLLHLFMSLLISTSHLLPPKTKQQVSPVLGTPAATWLGRPKNQMKRLKQPLEDHWLAPPSLPCCPLPGISGPDPCLSTFSWFGLKTLSGTLHGRRALDTRPSTLQRSNPSAATGTPSTRSRGTGRTQRLWTRAAPCEEGHALPASPCVATRPLTDGLH